MEVVIQTSTEVNQGQGWGTGMKGGPEINIATSVDEEMPPHFYQAVTGGHLHWPGYRFVPM